MRILNTTIQRFQELLLQWYGKSGRDLPWRRQVGPYAVFVSEIMLQQTQVERVLPKYEEFLNYYPTVQDLAAAESGDLLRLWQGMGYNSRVLRMRACAQELLAQHHGVFPKDPATLQTLPGIGAYTAGAIACFGWHESVAFVDTNIKRILHRVFVGLEFQGWQLSDKEIWQLAEKVFPRDAAFSYHQALMDVGSSYCRAAKLDCGECPLEQVCRTAKEVQKSPALLAKRQSYKKHTIPFKESKRYIRGGIVDCLRAHPQGVGVAVVEAYIHEHKRKTTSQELQSILGDLCREGVIHAFEGGYRL